MRLEYILIGFGIVLCLAGIGYLAAEYVKYLSEAGKLVSLLLTVGMFAFMGKYFEALGW
jgi:dipeptide/tripeptide permease